MASEGPLPQLRELRDQINLLDTQRADLVDGRDRLIRQAARENHSERSIAEAAGLSQPRIHQIVISR